MARKGLRNESDVEKGNALIVASIHIIDDKRAIAAKFV